VLVDVVVVTCVAVTVAVDVFVGTGVANVAVPVGVWVSSFVGLASAVTGLVSVGVALEVCVSLGAAVSSPPPVGEGAGGEGVSPVVPISPLALWERGWGVRALPAAASAARFGSSNEKIRIRLTKRLTRRREDEKTSFPPPSLGVDG
jgi:hypothetical protein